MIIKIFNEEAYTQTAWSGGVTTELYIYPENSSYQQRDFLFRLSTATVELEESLFTKLEGIKRKLMVLEGEVTLIHKDHHQKALRAFEQDLFMGDWETSSHGKVKDFNLMMKEGLAGTLDVIEIPPYQSIQLKLYKPVKGKRIEALFAAEQGICIENKHSAYPLNQGEIAILESEAEECMTMVDLTNPTTHTARCIRVDVVWF